MRKSLIMLLTCISLSNYGNAQSFMSREDFLDSLPIQVRNQINASVEKRWISNTSKEEHDILKAVRNKLTKKINISWSLHYDYRSYIDGFNVTVDNNSNKTIKYIKFNVKATNAVGDLVYEGNKTTTAIGPVLPKDNGNWEFEYVWMLNNTIHSVEITSISIEYTDKTKLLIKDINEFILEPETYAEAIDII